MEDCLYLKIKEAYTYDVMFHTAEVVISISLLAKDQLNQKQTCTIAILRSFRALFMPDLIEAAKQLNERFLRLELGCLEPASA